MRPALPHHAPRSGRRTPAGTIEPMAEITWRLKATRGHGWVRDIVGDAHQWASREAAEEAARRLPADRVPVRAVGGPAFERRQHGEP